MGFSKTGIPVAARVECVVADLGKALHLPAFEHDGQPRDLADVADREQELERRT